MFIENYLLLEEEEEVVAKDYCMLAISIRGIDTNRIYKCKNN